MQYDVYHDESKEAGYWHGILFVPQPNRQIILEHFATIRKEAAFNRPLSLKEIKDSGARFQCSRAMVQFAVFAMMQDTQGKVERVRVSTRTGDSEQKRQATEFREIICIDRPFGLKLVVFRERDDHKSLASHLDYGAKVETTFRIGFKCGLHFLFDENNPIVVSSLHFDGHEHYQRNIDTNRIIERLKPELRQYCQIEDGIVVDDRHGKHRQEDAQSKADHEFLQMTDLLIGSFRAVLGVNKSEVQAEVAAPVAGLVKKWNAGAARMKNSRWNRGFCISQCYLENNGWKFDDFRKKDDPNQSCLSLT